MATSEQARCKARYRDLRRAIGQEIQRQANDAGVSLRAIAVAADLDHAHLSRIARGDAAPSLEALVRIATALGAEPSVRLFPGTGPRIHDRIQARMIEALLAVLHPRLVAHPEVAILRPIRGYIDLVIVDAAEPRLLAVEVQSVMRRLDDHIRRHRDVAAGLAATQLARFVAADPDGESTPSVDRILILRSTESNREIARRFEQLLAVAYPARAADVYSALTGGGPWPGSGIVWAVVDGDRTHLLGSPPRRVTLGR